MRYQPVSARMPRGRPGAAQQAVSRVGGRLEPRVHTQLRQHGLNVGPHRRPGDAEADRQGRGARALHQQSQALPLAFGEKGSEPAGIVPLA